MPKPTVKRSDSMRNIARDLRQRQTPSETILWAALRDRRTLGHKFRRQYTIGRFVVDFFCSEAQLAVEIDGLVHDFQQTADIERQQTIEELGVRFVRVSAEQVETNLAGVLDAIHEALTKKG